MPDGRLPVVFPGHESGVSPVAAAIVANIEPVLNPIWVSLALGEKPGWLTIWGALLVICAVTAYGILNAKRTERGMRRADIPKACSYCTLQLFPENRIKTSRRFFPIVLWDRICYQNDEEAWQQ